MPSAAAVMATCGTRPSLVAAAATSSSSSSPSSSSGVVARDQRHRTSLAINNDKNVLLLGSPRHHRRSPGGLRAATAAAATSARRHVAMYSSASAASSTGDVSVSGWDLSEAPDGLILRLARELEAEWMRLPNLRDAPCAPELKSVDATAPDGDPSTRIRIENLCLQTDTFRKMHLEVAWGLGGIEVLHCVMYPWPHVPAPIFAAVG